jgi:hypothetical protein
MQTLLYLIMLPDMIMKNAVPVKQVVSIFELSREFIRPLPSSPPYPQETNRAKLLGFALHISYQITPDTTGFAPYQIVRH